MPGSREELPEMTRLRGLAWDHRRCWGPLDASVKPYCAGHPGLDIAWDRRSLYEFGEGALGPVLADYDLVVFDHPFIGDIAQDELMVPFDAHLSAEQIRFFEHDSVGASWRSYQKNGRQWALPIDAACQVASYRPDLLERYGLVPRTHKGVLELGRQARKDGKWLGLPYVPTDAMCLLLTFGNPQDDGEQFITRERAGQAVSQLRELAALSHPSSSQWNPIRCYDHMIAHDDVVYVPFAFGYVNYAAKTDRPYLRFADVPAPHAAGALLGGAGIGVSAQSKHKQEAIDYALFLCSPDYQRGEYVRAGGQPGSLAAWKDASVNQLSGNFFASTLQTIAASYLRPTHPGFIAFFRECAPHAAAAIAGDLSAADLTEHVNSLYRKNRQPERSVA